MASPGDSARITLSVRLVELESRAGHVHGAATEPVSADSEEAASERQDDDALAAEEALIARERAAITAALGRIDAGEWGDCTRCGEPIDPRRLEAQPEAALCIGCAGEVGGITVPGNYSAGNYSASLLNTLNSPSLSARAFGNYSAGITVPVY